MANVTPETLAIRQLILAEIKLANRTTVSLIAQGFTRSTVNLGLPALIKQGEVFRYGVGMKAYYSISPTEPEDAELTTDPVVIPESMIGNFPLAFRMGYTNVKPNIGRVFKERIG